MENILSRAVQAAEDAEVFFTSSEETNVHFETNRLKHLQTRQQTGVALRVIKDGRIGYATATGLGDAENLVATALETARFGTPARFELPATNSLPRVEIFDAGVEAVSNETMIRLGEELIAPVIKHTPDNLCSGYPPGRHGAHYQFAWRAGQLPEKLLQPGCGGKPYSRYGHALCRRK